MLFSLFVVFSTSFVDVALVATVVTVLVFELDC